MDTQQMLELLLARLIENAKTQHEDILARLDETARTHREKMKADMEEIRSKMDEVFAKMDRKASPEIMTATQTKTDVKLKELTEPREEMMQSAEEHQVVPREDAMAIPVRGRKRRHRGRKQAAGRRGEPKELIRGDRGSRKKLAAVCRKASRRAKVAWLKRNVFRKSRTCGYCGLRKEVAASRKKGTRCARHRRKVQNKEKVAQRSPTGGAFERRCRTSPECSNGIRDRGRRRIKDPSTRRQPRLKIKWTSEHIDRKIFYEILREKIPKHVVETSSRMQQMRNWTLWRGRPPPKRKKEPRTEQEPVM
jgi:hypothetical protein